MNNRVTPQVELFEYRDSCRICGEHALENVISFPDIPIADSLLGEEQLCLYELRLPLTFAVCTSCFHAQIREDASPGLLFNKNYPYYTGISPQLREHFVSSAKNLIRMFELDPTKKVVEIASNDGTMLEVFYRSGCAALGIDPASGPCMVAEGKGLMILNTFFTSKLSEEIRNDFGEADLILGNNVLAHVPDPGDLVAGISGLLSREGHVVIEVPHLLSLLKHVEFDGIFHQHYSYFSVRAAQELFGKHDLYLNDVELIPIHGGSIRLFFSRKESRSENLCSVLDQEAAAGLFELSSFKEFSTKVNYLKRELLNVIHSIRKSEKTIAGYGAAGKANTLINVCGIGTDDLKYIADLSKHKQGKYFTGAHLKIVSPDRILEDMPDYVLILAWNFKDEIMKQMSEYRNRGGKFIIPIPEVHVIV